MRVIHVKQAVFIVCVILCVWFLPVGVGKLLPAQTEKVATASTETATVTGEGYQATFPVPTGWRIEPTARPGELTLTKDDQVLLIMTLRGEFRGQQSLERALLYLNRTGISAAWSGKPIVVNNAIEGATDNDSEPGVEPDQATHLAEGKRDSSTLQGRQCIAVQGATPHTPARKGRCAIVGGSDMVFLITTLSLGTIAPDAEPLTVAAGAKVTIDQVGAE